MTVQAIIAAQQQADLARLHNNNRVLDSIHREGLSNDIDRLRRRMRELEQIIETLEEEIEIGRSDINKYKEAIEDYKAASIYYNIAIDRRQAAYHRKDKELAKAHLVAGQWSQVAQVLRESIKILLDEARTCPAQAHHVFGKGKSEETLWQEMHDEGIRRHNEEVASKAQPT